VPLWSFVQCLPIFHLLPSTYHPWYWLHGPICFWCYLWDSVCFLLAVMAYDCYVVSVPLCSTPPTCPTGSSSSYWLFLNCMGAWMFHRLPAVYWAWLSVDQIKSIIFSVTCHHSLSILVRTLLKYFLTSQGGQSL
jgi:hypothetical protein